MLRQQTSGQLRPLVLRAGLSAAISSLFITSVLVVDDRCGSNFLDFIAQENQSLRCGVVSEYLDAGFVFAGLLPGLMFGFVVVPGLRLIDPIRRWKSSVMGLISAISYTITLFAGGQIGDLFDLSDPLGWCLGGFAGCFVFMSAAAFIHPCLRSWPKILLGVASGQALSFLVFFLFYFLFYEEPVFSKLQSIIAAPILILGIWQIGFAITLGCLALWQPEEGKGVQMSPFEMK